jgi:hypothetical protein
LICYLRPLVRRLLRPVRRRPPSMSSSPPVPVESRTPSPIDRSIKVLRSAPQYSMERRRAIRGNPSRGSTSRSRAHAAGNGDSWRSEGLRNVVTSRVRGNLLPSRKTRRATPLFHRLAAGLVWPGPRHRQELGSLASCSPMIPSAIRRTQLTCDLANRHGELPWPQEMTTA